MSVLLVVVTAGTVAYVVGKAWTVLVPLAVGALFAVAAAAGGSLNDTPIPFAIALATIAAVFGLVIRRQRASLLLA